MFEMVGLRDCESLHSSLASECENSMKTGRLTTDLLGPNRSRQRQIDFRVAAFPTRTP